MPITEAKTHTGVEVAKVLRYFDCFGNCLLTQGSCNGVSLPEAGRFNLISSSCDGCPVLARYTLEANTTEKQ